MGYYCYSIIEISIISSVTVFVHLRLSTLNYRIHVSMNNKKLILIQLIIHVSYKLDPSLDC